MTVTRQFGGRDMVVVVLGVALGMAYAAAHSPLLAFAALIAVVFGTWVLARPDLVLYVVVASMPWNGMLEFPSPTLSIVKLLGVALAAAYLIRALRKGELVRLPPVMMVALMFGLVVGLSLITSTDPTDGLTKAFRYVFFILFLFLAIQMIDNREKMMWVLRVLCAATAAAAFYGSFLFLTGAVDRASGPIEDPNDFAYMTAAVLPIAIFLSREDRRWRTFWLLCALMLVGATFATLSRGALVGLGVLLLWAILTRRISITGTVWIVFSSIALVAVAVTLFSSLISERLEEKNHIGAANVESRAAFWSAAERMTIDHPVLGVGPGRFSPEAKNYVRNSPIVLEDPLVHNSYLEILAEDGPFALLLFLGMLACAWVAATRAERLARSEDDAQTRRLASTIKAMLIVAIVSGAFLSEQVAPPFWLACALAGALALPAASVALSRSRMRPALSS